MKATEKNYAIQRVCAIIREKESKIAGKYEADTRYHGDAEKVEAIKAGKAKKKKDIVPARYSGLSLDNVFTWPWDKKYEAAVEKGDKEMADMRRKGQRVKDELMLGSEKEALEMLRKFEAE
jgi:hypothetical protein